MKNLLAELRRRNVFRVAAAYLVVGWIVMQVVATIGGAAGLPDWADSFALIILVAGFPVVLFIAWAFELTPDGMKKTETSDERTDFKPLGSSDYILIAAMLVVLGVVGFQSLGGSPEQNIATTAAPVSTPHSEDETLSEPVSEASIAVLPFADFSPEADQQYFSDGIAEELLNALAQFPELRVAARTSAFSFRGDDVDLREVGEALNVAHVLEGSVRQSGDQLRITAQLIRASDGYHLWSQTYERTLTDVFEIQDDIVRELSRVLQVRLGIGGGAGRATIGEINPRAYEQYLRGLSLWGNRSDGTNRDDAVSAFQLATQYDSGFADAWAAYGISVAISGEEAHGLDNMEARRISANAFSQALEIDPDNARAHAGLGLFHTYRLPDIGRSLHHSQRALELAPSAAYAHYARASSLSWSGDYAAADRAYSIALSLDPLNATISRVWAEELAFRGDMTRMERVLGQCPGCTDLLFDAYRYSAALQSASEDDVRRQEVDYIEAYHRLTEGQPADEIADDEVEIRAITNCYLGDVGACSALISAISEARATGAVAMHFVLLYALAGDYESATDHLFVVYGDEETVELANRLLPGRLEFPEPLRRHPRFHEFWELPGMPELAAVRRANGQTGGLPLPVEANDLRSNP